MKLIKGGLLAALVALCAFAFTAASASANLLPARWSTTSGSWIFLDGGLGGTRCDVAARGVLGSVSAITFSNCRGIAGTPTALLTWTIDLTTKTIAVRALSVVLFSSCLYTGRVAFTETLTPALVVTLGASTVPLTSGGSVCPSSVIATGVLNIV